MKVQVHNTQGEQVGRELDLDDSVFGIEPNEHVLYLAVKSYLAAQRTGTHATKEVSQLSGSTRKLKRQKGTGGARAGSIKSPLFRGGATVFGPRPRKYTVKLNKKVKRLARVSALSAKAQAEGLHVVENFDFDAPKTKDARVIVDKVLSGKRGSVLVVTEGSLPNVRKSFANLPNAKVVTANTVNVYDVLKAKTLVLTEGSVDFLTNALRQNAPAAADA